MNKPRLAIFLAAIAGTVLAAFIGALAATQLIGGSRSGIFPEKLGEMTLAAYVEGPAAVAEVKALHPNDPVVQMQNAYVARYTGPGTGSARFWVSESATADEAGSLLDAMTRTVGNSGVFSQPSSVPAEGATVYFVQGPPEIGLYNYLYAIDKKVFWVQVDNPDPSRRLDILAEAISRIKR